MEHMRELIDKSGGHRRLLDVGFYELKNTIIEYQMEKYGKSVVLVNPAYSSKECARCNYVNKGITLADRVFVCLRCGWTANRDVNSGMDIMERADWETAVELRPLPIMRQGGVVKPEATSVRMG